MARSEPESDLMRDATGLVRRVELDWPGDDRPLVAGFRRDEVLSFYFGESPVYQFDADGRLRRAFLDPDRYRTQGNTLARLARTSEGGRVVFDRDDLDPDTLEEFHRAMRSRLERLSESLDAEAVTVLAQVGESDDVVASITAALPVILDADPWLAPAIPGKR